MINEASKILWDNFIKRIKSPEQIDKIEFLKSIELFSDLTSRQIDNISNIIHERKYQEGEYIFEYNQPGAALFIIKSGLVSIRIPSNEGKITEVIQLGDGTFLGEIALLDNSPRSASAKALKPTYVLSLFREDLTELIEEQPEEAAIIFRSLAMIVGHRLKSTTKMIQKEKI